jgi:hypothetical protein
MSVLANKPGAPCENGGRGACRRTGTFVCEGQLATGCNALQAAAQVEVCDSIDNDCNGIADDNATDAIRWHQDCNLNGIGTGTVKTPTIRACSRPPPNAAGCPYVDNFSVFELEG